MKSYQWSITNGSRHSGEPNECARAGASTISGDEGGHTFFVYQIADLQSGTYAAAIADERDNHLLLEAGPDRRDLIRLLFEGFEILVIDSADDIDKHSALAIGRMNRDGRGHTPFGKHHCHGSNQSRL